MTCCHYLTAFLKNPLRRFVDNGRWKSRLGSHFICLGLAGRESQKVLFDKKLSSQDGDFWRFSVLLWDEEQIATEYFLGISEKAFFGTGRGFVVPLTLFLTSAGKDERMKPLNAL